MTKNAKGTSRTKMIDSVGSFLHCQGVDDRALLPWLVLVRFYLR